MNLCTESSSECRPLKAVCLDCNLAIVGGGLAGTCCAITAARAGLKVVLIQDRPVLGGNASSEVRLWILGATSHMGNNNRWAREGGVVDEILVENMYRNPEGNPVIVDTILLEKVVSEPNITLLLNTAVHDLEKSDPAFLLYAWPQLKQWLPQSFYDRCHDFAFTQWKQVGLLEVDPLWDAKTYLTPEQMEGRNPTGGPLHPYKGRHAPGHSIQPNLLMHEVAKREGRSDADLYLNAVRTQAQWIIEHLDWNDPRTTKGHRMSEYKTMTGLVWFLQNYPKQVPAGLKQKIIEWARVMIQRSDNMWDFRRYDLQEHWTIPKLNEPGNLVGFTASALAASWVVDDAAMKRRLQELAIAQMDNVFGRNPRLAAAPEYPQKGWPSLERGWPKNFPDNVCARLELTRGSLSASPGTEMYPFNPGGAFRHAEGWVNFNAAWNVALGYLKWNETNHAP